jgi:hypothetical protein
MTNPNIILVVGKRRTGKTMLIPRIIDAFRLSNVINYNLSTETIEIPRTTVERTLVIDGDSYDNNFFRVNMDFFCAARTYNATVIITLQRLEDIPYHLRLFSDYTFIFPTTGFGNNSFVTHNTRILYSSDFDRYLQNILSFEHVNNIPVNNNSSSLATLQNIIFDNRSNISDNDYLNAMNALQSLHNRN